MMSSVDGTLFTILAALRNAVFLSLSCLLFFSFLSPLQVLNPCTKILAVFAAPDTYSSNIYRFKFPTLKWHQIWHFPLTVNSPPVGFVQFSC